MKSIRSERLLLRKYVPGDAHFLYEKIGKDESSYRYSGWNPYATPEMAEDTVNEFISSYSDPDFYGWIIEYNGEPAGTIGAYDHEGDSIEVGFTVAGDFRGRGFAGEALKGVISYLTEDEGIRCVTAWCASENIASAKTLEKAGMVLIKTEPGALKVGGDTYDKLIYEYDARVRYTILDPTGNITALVETYTSPDKQPEIASGIMRRHPEVEQVGFFRMADEAPQSEAPAAENSDDVDAVLRMAGGEFCGNASMCAAALYAIRTGKAESVPERVMLKVSGAKAPVAAEITCDGEGSFCASVQMPAAKSIIWREFEFEDKKAELPVVVMEGISHIIIEKSSPFYELKNDRPAAKMAVKKWCRELSVMGLGIMFLEETESGIINMIPLVYIPGADSLFWENSCASGSAAAGTYLAYKENESDAPDENAAVIKISQPGGALRVEIIAPDGECAAREAERTASERERAAREEENETGGAESAGSVRTKLCGTVKVRGTFTL